MNKIAIGIVLGVLTLYGLGTLLAGIEKSTDVSDIQLAKKVVSVSYMDEKSSVTPVGSQIAYLDPITGELTSKSADAFNAKSSLQAEVNLPPVKLTTYADGSVKADLNGRFRTPLMATIGCDGELTTGHSDELQSKVKDCGETK